MKISIWQQFSSNHSNSFELVGKFKTVDAAKKAAAEFQNIIDAVAQYRHQFWKEKRPFDFENASNLERKFGEKYGVEWKEHLDWMAIDTKVTQFDNYVVVDDSAASTWKGAKYVDRIMEKMGAEIFVSEEMGSDIISTEVTCQTSSIEQATKIFNILNPYLKKVRNYHYPDEFPEAPWKPEYEMIVYHGYVSQDETTLHFTKMNLLHSIPEFIAYLKSIGCDNIKYVIKQIDAGEYYGNDASGK